MNKARLAGGVYLLVFVTGIVALAVRGSVGSIAGSIAGVLYIAVTVLFYGLFKSVNQRLSLLAAAVTLCGIAAGPLFKVNPLPPGVIGEGSLTIWLLVAGVEPDRG